MWDRRCGGTLSNFSIACSLAHAGGGGMRAIPAMVEVAVDGALAWLRPQARSWPHS